MRASAPWRQFRAGTQPRPSPVLPGLAGVAALTAGLGCKSDLILLFAAFPTLALALRPDLSPSSLTALGAWVRDWRRWLPSLLPAFLMPGIASLLFLGLRSLILHRGLVYLLHDSGEAVAGVLEWPHGSQIIKQLLPMVTAFGGLLALITAAGVIRSLLRWTAGTWPLAVLAIGWSLPSYVFWFLIRGNNVRHMADVVLPLLWLGLQGWEGARWPAAPTLAAAAIILDLWIIPPSSNLTLYPSGDVPGSVRDLHQRLGEIQRELRTVPVGSNGSVCYLGNATLPYLELAFWNSAPDAILTVQNETETLHLANGTRIDFIEVNSSVQYRQAATACSQPRSLEYAPNGVHQWFLGREWGSLPFHERWYSTRYQAPRR